MFLVNSRLGLSSATHQAFSARPIPQWVPLLPKLRGHFAEFLNEGSPARLWILSSPTCVGFRYGHQAVYRLEAFLGSLGSAASVLSFPPLRLSGHTQDGFAYPAPYWLGRALPTARSATLLRHPFASCSVAGDSLPLPHRLRSRLGLGPGLPWADYPPPGTLRLPAVRFLTLLSLLMPAFSLLYSPASLTLGLLPVQYAPLPHRLTR